MQFSSLCVACTVRAIFMNLLIGVVADLYTHSCFTFCVADVPVITCQQYELFFKLGETAAVFCKIEAYPRGKVMLEVEGGLLFSDLVLSEKVCDVLWVSSWLKCLINYCI